MITLLDTFSRELTQIRMDYRFCKGNIDMSTPKLLAETDQKMISTLTIKDYFKYIMMTVTGSGKGDAVNTK